MIVRSSNGVGNSEARTFAVDRTVMVEQRDLSLESRAFSSHTRYDIPAPIYTAIVTRAIKKGEEGKRKVGFWFRPGLGSQCQPK